MLTQLRLQPTTKKVSSESIGRQCNPTLYRFPVPQLMGLKSTTLVIPRCRQTKLMGPTTQKQNLNSVNVNYVCGNFLYAKCNEFNNNYVLFWNLNVHFLCTDVMITPLLLRLVRSFVKVKISCVYYCTLYTSVSLKSEFSIEIHFTFKKG